MFRPVPKTEFLRSTSHRLIASIIVSLAVAILIVLFLGLERDEPLFRQSGFDFVVLALFLLVMGGLGLAGVIAFFHHDTTRRTLEEVKGLARNILQSIPTGVLTINPVGVITAVNPAAESVFQRSSADLLGNAYESVFPVDDMIRRVLDEALREHRHVSHKDLPYVGREGNPHTIRVSTADLSGDEGASVGVILQAQDVTDWLGLEQRVRVAEKLAALHTLSAGMAHELRNPLSAMDLNLHLLEEELAERRALSEQGLRYIRVVNAECRRLSMILDSFMKFARPTSVGLHPVDMEPLLSHIMALMRFEAEERKIRLEEAVDSSLTPVSGDETAISQVLINIIVNAFHAMPDGGLCRLAAAERTVDGKRWIAVTVTDTGVGIATDHLHRIFEPFFTTKSTGTGLGLPIAYRIMEDHGGMIHVRSMRGAGTTVEMLFPPVVEDHRAVSCLS
ncbi:MAG: ATP-binding protein [Nitrospira sp.]